MLQPSLPVGRVDGSEEPFSGAAPQSAAEYLRRVRAEALRIPDIMLADGQADRSYEDEVDTNLRPPQWAPPAAWTRSVLADLAELRVRLGVYSSNGLGTNRETIVPKMKDGDAWRQFCDDTPPRTRLVLQFDSAMTQAVLAHHVRWVDDEDSLTDARARWLYAILARLEKPLHRDVLAVLRRLVKRLLVLRAALADTDHPCLPKLQLLIVVAGLYFGQAAQPEVDGQVDLPDYLPPPAELDDDDDPEEDPL